MLRKDKNKNEKRNRETEIIGKKGRKPCKKKAKLEKLKEIPEKTSEETELQNLNLAGITKSRIMGLCLGNTM
jgi:hypothetical protein